MSHEWLAQKWEETYYKEAKKHAQLKEDISHILDEAYSYKTGDYDKLNGDPNDHWVVDYEALRRLLDE